MKTLMICLLATLSLPALSYTEKGNGGDVVLCNGKLQTLDSAVMEDSGNFKREKEKTYELKISKIKKHLAETLPSLEKDLTLFLDIFKKKKDLEERNILWIKGMPKDVKDENLFVELPEGCKDLKQAIVKRGGENGFDNIRFYYSDKVLAELEKTDDELSWLLVHEWLRNFSKDSEEIRLINAYLHSSEFAKDSDIKVRSTLYQLNVGYEAVGDLYSEIKRSQEKIAKLEENVKPKIELLQLKFIKANLIIESYLKNNGCKIDSIKEAIDGYFYGLKKETLEISAELDNFSQKNDLSYGGTPFSDAVKSVRPGVFGSPNFERSFYYENFKLSLWKSAQDLGEKLIEVYKYQILPLKNSCR